MNLFSEQQTIGIHLPDRYEASRFTPRQLRLVWRKCDTFSPTAPGIAEDDSPGLRSGTNVEHPDSGNVAIRGDSRDQSAIRRKGNVGNGTASSKSVRSNTEKGTLWKHPPGVLDIVRSCRRQIQSGDRERGRKNQPRADFSEKRHCLFLSGNVLAGATPQIDYPGPLSD
jgi:hypothetical protein